MEKDEELSSACSKIKRRYTGNVRLYTDKFADAIGKELPEELSETHIMITVGALARLTARVVNNIEFEFWKDFAAQIAIGELGLLCDSFHKYIKQEELTITSTKE